MQAPLDMPHIPAMTTEAERELFYSLVRHHAHEGAVIELGAWLGASTAWIAAGIRDAGVDHKAQVYDRFQSKRGHAEKVKAFYAEHGGDGAMPEGDCLAQFRSNLGPLIEYVEPHKAEIANIQWGDEKIAVLITDAPKRVPEISAVLTALRGGLQPGSIMAWQDLCHFPSYDIPACLYRLSLYFDFKAAAVPGTTLAFEVTEQWDADAVSVPTLALQRWSVNEVRDAWDWWLENDVPAEKASLFRCGAAMFLCDLGYHGEAVDALAAVYRDDPDAILPKWQYLHRVRPAFRDRYAPLFAYLAKDGALC